ncbi:MAG TPA: ABC transporter substrate-binding protein [Burkholderiaceae bacterium]|nr:ABC transporter substrate-binding protein [Burkholderiaceae bacterium]
MKRVLPRLFAGCLALTLSWAMAADGVTKNQILIGQSITLQGGKNDYGLAVQDGIQTYLNLVNSRGGVNGRQIVLKTLDDDNKGNQAETNARQLVEQDKVFILFGSIEGGPSTAVMKAAVDLKVPFFGPIAGSPTLRRPHQPLVFPVRAEHREEFRALLGYGKSIGATRVGFLRSDSETGQQHLANVKLLSQELGMELVADLPFKSDIGDVQIDQMVGQLEKTRAQVVFNHGSPGVYEKLIRKSRAKGLPTAFYAVNSGSAQMAKHLGPLAHGMVFTQVVPSPWERKTAITREYQEEFSKQKPGREFSYGSLEGYVTAKALVAALRLAGPEPSRESFLAGLANASLDLNGLRAVYSRDQHTGLSFVDLAIVTREGTFRH